VRVEMYVSCSLKIKGCKDGQYFSIYKSLAASFLAWELAKELNHILVKSLHPLSLQSVLGRRLEIGVLEGFWECLGAERFLDSGIPRVPGGEEAEVFFKNGVRKEV
jgi:hypothetical protein